MNLLLDTHMLLWAAAGTMPKEAEALVLDGDNRLYFSPASIWEIGIKKSLGRSETSPVLSLRQANYRSTMQ